MKISFLILALAFTAFPAFEDTAEHPYPKPQASPELERIKALAGTWEGQSETGGKVEDAKVEYTLSSGGSAVVEKLFPGTEHEMVSVYYDENGKLAMQHYCMLAAKPKLDLKSSDAKNIELDFSKSNTIDTSQPHMHSLSLSFPSEKELVQRWTGFEGEGKQHSTVMTFKKV